jgi:S-DNA-T family DNA segregation ATPase FtsK/SpoIIIE
VILRRQLSAGTPPPRLRFRGPNLHVPLWALAAGWALAGAGRAVLWLVLHPRTAVVLAIVVLLAAGVIRWGWAPYGYACAVASVVFGLWWARWPESYERQVAWRLQGWWRRFIYWRDWQPAMVTSGLAHAAALGASLPRLRSVTTDGAVDVVRVRMLPGQTLEQWQAAAPKLATTFQLRAVRVRRVLNRPQDVDLTCRRRSAPVPDVTPIPAVTEPAVADDPQPQAPSPGAFPRAPRRAS